MNQFEKLAPPPPAPEFKLPNEKADDAGANALPDCGPKFHYVFVPPKSGSFRWDGQGVGKAKYKDDAGGANECDMKCQGFSGSYRYFHEDRTDGKANKTWVFGPKSADNQYPVGCYNGDGSWSGWFPAISAD
jgi:hypothetical protein